MRKGLIASLAVLVGAAGLAPAQPPPAPAPQTPAQTVSLGQPLPLDAPSPPAGGATMWTAAASGTPVASPAGDPPALPPVTRGAGEPLPPGPPPLPPPPPPAVAAPVLDGLAPGRSAPCIWTSAEYLLWWVKNGPLPTPLVTTGSLGGVNPGALNDPTTRVLLGAGNQDYGAFSGFRAALGGWLDSCQTWGLEGTGFFLARNSTSSGVSTGGIGGPPLFITYVNPFLAPPGEAAFPITVPGTGTTATVSTSSSLWGLELRGLYNFFRNDMFHAEGLAGFRYLQLKEDLDFNVALDYPSTAGLTAAASLSDSFQTRNQFYGGEIGARGGVRWGHFTADVFTTLALGGMHESVDVNGSKAVSATVPGLGSFGAGVPGGFFTQASNIGHQSKDHFAIIPEIGVQLGYQFTPHFRAFVGYNFLYVSNVVRPGNQIDRTVNTTQLLGTPPVFGPSRPSPLFNQTDYWAQGINFGLEFRW